MLTAAQAETARVPAREVMVLARYGLVRTIRGTAHGRRLYNTADVTAMAARRSQPPQGTPTAACDVTALDRHVALPDLTPAGAHAGRALSERELLVQPIQSDISQVRMGATRDARSGPAGAFRDMRAHTEPTAVQPGRCPRLFDAAHEFCHGDWSCCVAEAWRRAARSARADHFRQSAATGGRHSRLVLCLLVPERGRPAG
jgi:DNA-binding transcriptional MerR regulator